MVRNIPLCQQKSRNARFAMESGSPVARLRRDPGRWGGKRDAGEGRLLFQRHAQEGGHGESLTHHRLEQRDEIAFERDVRLYPSPCANTSMCSLW